MYGVDLAELWARRRYIHLLALIDGLPSASRYTAAVMDDEDFAESILDSGQADAKPSSPSLATWTPELSALTDIKDMISSLIQTEIGIAGGKAKNPKPAPRPETAIDRVTERRNVEAQQDILSNFYKSS